MKNSTAFVLLLIAIGTTYTFTMPTWAEVADYQAQETTFKDVLNHAHEIEAKRDELYAQYQHISPEQLDQIKKILPNNVDTVTLALNLDAIAAHYGISLKSVKTSTTDPNPGQNAIILPDGTVSGSASTNYQTVYVDFEVTSNYDNFRKFLTDVEKSLRIIDIKSIEMKPAGQDGKLYNFSVSIKTYWTK